MDEFLKKEQAKLKRYCISRAVSEIVRRTRFPQKYLTVGELLSIGGIDVNAISPQISKLLDVKIRHIGKADYRLRKNSICQIMESVDKADFAMQNGAVLLISKKQIKNYPCVVVDNPVEVYSNICRYYRDMLPNLTTTVVTGSIGKTTAKEMIDSVYSVQYRTSCCLANSNTIHAVGYAAQHISPHAEKMIQEISEDEPNTVQYVSSIMHPKVVVLTAIDKSHFEHFGSEEAIAEEICSAVKGMTEDGNVIVNLDDFSHFNLLEGHLVKTVSIENEKADYWASEVNVKNDGLHFNIHYEGNNSVPMILPNIYAVHNVISALYAFAAGMCEGVNVDNIVKGLSSYRTSGIRQNVVRTEDGILLYADCYNSIAKSVKSAICAADSIPVEGCRIAVIGDIGECGGISDQIHEELIQIVNDSSFNILLSVGSKINKAVANVKVRSSLQIKACANNSEVNKFIRENVKCGDLLLFKASHSGHLDSCIKSLWPREYKMMTSKNSKSYAKWCKESCFY